jgi:hypothetical protein
VLDDAKYARIFTAIETLPQTEPDARTAVLVALLHALGCEHKIVDLRPYGCPAAV